MSDILIQFAPEHAEKSKEEKAALIDAEVTKFSDYMATLPDPLAQGKLHPAERMLVGSYLAFRLREGK